MFYCPKYQVTAMEDLALSSSELEALNELEKRIPKDTTQKIFDDPFVYYRFLKARDFDVNESEKMLKNTLKWRKETGTDDILTKYKPLEIFQILYGKTKISYDKEGSPVHYYPLGKFDVKGLMKSVTDESYKQFLVYLLRKLEVDLLAQIKKMNKNISLVIIYDLSELTFANAVHKRVIELFIWYSKMMQDNYPERLKALYIINASRVFTFPFSIIKNFLISAVLNKIQVFGEDGWKQHFANIVDINDLPVVLGGKKTDPDGNPLCLTIIYQGGKIDEKYYLSKTKKSIQHHPDVQKLVISRAAFEEIKIKIQKPESIIEWEFEIKTKDIGFGLFFTDAETVDSELKEIVPLKRQSTIEVSESGMYKCEKAGTYIMVFDNSYSWFRSKEIYYLIKTIQPKDHQKKMIEL